MKYYMILLIKGRVVEICSFDTEEARDDAVRHHRGVLLATAGVLGGSYDEVQTLNEVR